MKFIILLMSLFATCLWIDCEPTNRAYVITIEVNDSIEIEEFSFKGKPKNQQQDSQFIPAIFGQAPQQQPATIAPQTVLPVIDATTSTQSSKKKKETAEAPVDVEEVGADEETKK
jgi:hypothetical protein